MTAGDRVPSDDLASAVAWRACAACIRSAQGWVGLRQRASLLVFLHTIERFGVVGTAYAVALGSRRMAIVATGAFAGLFLVRSALRAAVARAARAVLVDSSIRSLLGGEPMRLPDSDDLGVTVHEGIYLGEQFIEHAIALMGDLVAALGLAGFIVALAPPRWLALGALAATIASGAILVAKTFTVPLVLAAQRAARPIYQDLGDAAAGRIEIVAAGVSDDIRDQVRRHLAKWQRVAARSDLGAGVMGRAPALAAAGAVGLVLALDASVRGQGAEVPLRVAAVGASVVPAFLGLARGATDVFRMLPRLRPFVAVLGSESALVGGPQRAIPRLPAPIAWRSVSLTYCDPQRQISALTEISAVWAPGRVLVLHGPNGAGKSTMLRSLLGLARPTSGTITVAGVDLFELDLRGWRRSVAYLPQRPYLSLHATVREAIRLIARDATDEAICDALSRVGLWTPLATHASDDPLGIRVGSLSVGERQRLALARTLCQPSKIILLDEPDANLDAEGIAMVARIVREIASARMVAVAAHTAELVRHGDIRVDLRNGRFAVAPAASAGE